MPKNLPVSAGHVGQAKVTKEFPFSTKTEAVEALKAGKAPVGWESIEAYHMCAVAHRVVELQNEIRASIDGPKTSTAKKHILAE